jgi:hypothetical protein
MQISIGNREWKYSSLAHLFNFLLHRYPFGMVELFVANMFDSLPVVSSLWVMYFSKKLHNKEFLVLAEVFALLHLILVHFWLEINRSVGQDDLTIFRCVNSYSYLFLNVVEAKNKFISQEKHNLVILVQ